MNLNKVISLIGEFMDRKIKARAQNALLENLRVVLSPVEFSEQHGPEQEKELVSLVAQIVRLGRSVRRKKKKEELSYAA